MKNIVYTLLAAMASVLIAHAQTNLPASGQPAAAPVPAVNTVAPPAPPATPPAPETAASNVPEAGMATAASASIPLIQFSDVPITTAIENLARQAGINYMLDPKIGFGQADANGQVRAEPQLSIRWENITAEHALLALLENYGLQLVADKKTGIERVTQKDPMAPPPLLTRVVQLKFSSTSNMTEAVQSVLSDKRSKVLADNRTSQIVVSATEPEQLAVDTLMAQLDKPTKQVLIETRFVEVQSNPQTSKGIDWSGTFAAQNVSFGNGVTGTQPASSSGGSVSSVSSSSTTAPGVPVTSTFGGHTITTTPDSTTATTLNSVIQGSQSPGGLSWNTLSGLTPAIGFLNADGVHAVLSMLNQSSDAQVISTPRLVTLDNQTARIAVVRGIPVINVTAGTVQNAGGSSVTYSNVGTTLEVTPRISANDFIWLKVVPEISVNPGKDNEIIGGALYSAPLFDSRRIETQVLIPNANTLVMGGLVTDNPKSQTTKVPFLGDIPYLGYAFRSETKSSTKDNLIIFITPTIVKDTDFRPVTSTYLSTSPDIKSPVKFDEHSPWDTTRPADWSADHSGSKN